MKEKTKRTLEMLVERVDTLKDKDYATLIAKTGFGFHANRTEAGPFAIKFDLPDEKERNDSVVTLRQFTSQKDDISFSQLKKLLKSPDLSQAWKDGFRKLEKEYTEYFDGYPENVEEAFFFPGDHPTRREIYDAIMSFTFHAQIDNQGLANYRKWTREEIRAAVLHQVFNRTVFYILNFIFQVAELSKRELNLENA